MKRGDLLFGESDVRSDGLEWGWFLKRVQVMGEKSDVVVCSWERGMLGELLRERGKANKSIHV